MSEQTLHFRFGEAMNRAPHPGALGLKLTQAEAGRAELILPYHDGLVGDPATRVIAGGAITAMLDQVCGIAVMTALKQLAPIATLDLRIDYMRPAPPDHDVRGRAHCFRVTRSIAFVRAVAFIDDENDPVATANAAFIITPAQGGAPA